MCLMKMSRDFFIHTKDVNHKDIIRGTAILDMFQDIAGLHADKLGVGYLDLKSKNYAWVILYQKYEIKKCPPYLEDVTLTTWPKPKRRLEFEREYILTDHNSNLLVQGISNWVIIDLTTRSLVRSRDIIFNGEYETFTNYDEPCKRRLNLDTSLIEDYLVYQVELEDLDHNGHMNNTRYLHIIENRFYSIDSKVFIKDVEICFVKEAKYKETIRIGFYHLDNKIAFIGYLNDDICFECLIGEEEI